jgi:hypothetical protein
MSSEHFNAFWNLETGASYFLNQAFKHINAALEEDATKIIFSEKQKHLDIPSVEINEVLNSEFGNNVIALLQSNNFELLEDEFCPIYIAQREAREEAKNVKKFFSKTHKISSLELLGHINNFAFFIESIVNKHLLFLKLDNHIDSFSYNRLENAGIISKLIFVLKENLVNNSLSINNIHSLFGYRNQSVHYTPKATKAKKIQINELLNIWSETIQVINHFHSIEQFRLDETSSSMVKKKCEFKERWIK